MNVLEGTEGLFEVVWTGMAIVGQEEGNTLSDIGSCACGEPVEATN